MAPLRVGVVGVGFGAAVHIPAFLAEGVEVTAVCARRLERAEEAAARFGIRHSFSNLDEMLARTDIDAVSISSPPAEHHAMVLSALAAGKHVICEKPFCLDAASARELWQTAQKSGLTAMIAHEFRFASGRMRAKELIEQGFIGDLRLVLIRMLVSRPARPAQLPAGGEIPVFDPQRDLAALGGGLLFSLGSHYIDCLRHWFGEVTAVSGDLRTFSADRLDGSRHVEADIDDTLSFVLEFESGGMAQMTASRAARFGGAPSVEIYGSMGTLVTPQHGVNPPAHGTLLGAKVDGEALQPLEVPPRLQPFSDERDDRLMPFRLFVREFVRGVAEGRSPAPNFYDGYRCQQVLDAVRQSSAEGRRISIESDQA